MTASEVREPGARALSLVELKAAWFDAAEQAELWGNQAKAIQQRINEEKARLGAQNGVPTLDVTPGP